MFTVHIYSGNLMRVQLVAIKTKRSPAIHHLAIRWESGSFNYSNSDDDPYSEDAPLTGLLALLFAGTHTSGSLTMPWPGKARHIRK